MIFSKSKLTLYIIVCFLPIAHCMEPNFILILTDDHGWTSTSTKMDKTNPLSVSDYHETPGIDGILKPKTCFNIC